MKGQFPKERIAPLNDEPATTYLISSNFPKEKIAPIPGAKRNFSEEDSFQRIQNPKIDVSNDKNSKAEEVKPTSRVENVREKTSGSGEYISVGVGNESDSWISEEALQLRYIELEQERMKKLIRVNTNRRIQEYRNLVEAVDISWILTKYAETQTARHCLIS